MSRIKKLIEDLHSALTEGQDLPSLEALQKDFDGKPLADEIEQRLGFDPGLKIEVTLGRRGPLVSIESENVADKCGVFKEVFKEVHVSNFGGSIDKENGDINAWVPVHIDWAHKKGGTNGADWFTAWYNFDKKVWTFRD